MTEQEKRNNECYKQQEILDELYKKSCEGRYFNRLYELIINEDNIMQAYKRIKINTGSNTKGINGHTIKYLERLSKDNLIGIVRERLSNYTPNPVRMVFISKSNGKQRPLGITNIEDRLIQQCILQILEPICEGKFHKDSFGFRPNRNTHYAIARCQHLINHSSNHFVVDVDIEGFFYNINHGKLMKQIWNIGIRDKRLLCIISKMLKSRVVDKDISTKGTSQLGYVSQSKIDPKRKSKIIKVYQSKLKNLSKSPSMDKVKDINGFTLGIHNYYKVATDISQDFHDIMHSIYGKYKTLKRRHIITEKGVENEVIRTFYSGYEQELDKCCNITLYPIPFVHFKKPIQIHPEVTLYTEVGRCRIHNTLAMVLPHELKALRRGNFGKRSIEYMENRISRFVGQSGKCYITGMRLYPDEVHCHHKIPLKLGGNDKYDNLIIVHKDIHKLIHSTNIKLILQSTKDWTIKSKSKFNQLRKYANLELIDFRLVT